MKEPFDLDRLLSAAADDFRPTADPMRLDAMIMRRGHRRRMLVAVGAAASVVLLGSVALAHRVDDSRERLGPAHEDVVDHTSTTEKEHEPLTTKPKETEPGEPDATEPDATEPDVTEPKVTEPKSTAPKTTAPKETEPTEPKPTEPEWEFKAFQTYGECSESPPYDVFYGETKPGAKVVIESEWSERVEIYADENGHWEVQVFFPESPIGQEIKVYIVSLEHTYKFWFTHTEAV